MPNSCEYADGDVDCHFESNGKGAVDNRGASLNPGKEGVPVVWNFLSGMAGLDLHDLGNGGFIGDDVEEGAMNTGKEPPEPLNGGAKELCISVVIEYALLEEVSLPTPDVASLKGPIDSG